MQVTINGVNDGAKHSDVRLPGSLMAPSVSSASNSDLKDCLAKDLEAVASIIEPTKPTKEGMAPEQWHQWAKDNRGQHNTLAALERIERRIVAIRSELVTREAQAKAEAEAEQERARKELEKVLEMAPKQASELVELAEMVVPAAERIRQFVADLELVAGGARLAEQHVQIQDGAKIAAGALDQPKPELETLPEGLPTSGEAKHLINTISGRIEGFARLGVSVGSAHQARELARTLS